MAVEIVAELGQNHNGSLDVCLRMIEAAKAAGVDAVKLQKRHLPDAIPESQRTILKSTPWGLMSYLEYRERLEFTVSQYDVIDQACKTIGIKWFVSVWDIPSLETMVARYPDMPYIKIPSACLTDDLLLAEAAGCGIPVVLSTGMSTAAEVDHAMHLFDWGAEGNDFTVCHCNSTYPCPVGDLNLRCLAWLNKTYPWARLGYSGHEVGLATTIAAVALGAQYVERHFTLDRSMWGSDQAASVEPGGFKRLVKDIRNVEQALGDGLKRVTPGELEAMRRLRRIPSPA